MGACRPAESRWRRWQLLHAEKMAIPPERIQLRQPAVLEFTFHVPLHQTSSNMSGSTYTYTLTGNAYTIPLLHAARYTAHTVLGIFLGTIDETTRRVIIQDAIPLLHHYTSLSPVAEAGLTLIEEEAKGKGLKLVGLYVAHEGSVNGLGRVGERILEGLKVGFEGVVGLTVSLLTPLRSTRLMNSTCLYLGLKALTHRSIMTDWEKESSHTPSILLLHHLNLFHPDQTVSQNRSHSKQTI